MKSLKESPQGSRIASVHNGSSLFTGDAGGSESNIRRYIIENDLLEAIIQLPNNLFYNTGITTYIWLLSNNKAAQRQGKVQFIDGSQLYRKLRKNLGEKNCEFAPQHIQQISDCYQQWGDAVYQSKTLEDNDLNLNAKNRKKLISLDLWQKHRNLVHIANQLMAKIGQKSVNDFNQFFNII